MKGPFEFFPYGDMEAGPKYDVVIHARSETRYRQLYKNWPVENYVKVLKQLGYPKAACIGTSAYRIPRCDDLRGVPLKKLFNVMASAKVVMGPSSGPMHLAHLCGAPIVVWTGLEHQKAINGTNKDRYKKLWRAWDTPVRIVEGWQPSPKAVARAVGKHL
jgi:ADP-heptose:LPS heptosyltransferase